MHSTGDVGSRNSGAAAKAARDADELALRSVISEQQAAIEGLEATQRELESMVIHLLLAGKATAKRTEAADGQGKVARKASLSKRELQVLGLMVAGKTSKEIAVELGVSFKTAVTHRANIMAKLEVHETASAVREAIRRGLV